MFRTPELDVHIHICEATGVAARLGGAPGEALLDGARSAYVHGMGTALVVAVGVALAGAVVVLLFLPARGEPMPE